MEPTCWSNAVKTARQPQPICPVQRSTWPLTQQARSDRATISGAVARINQAPVGTSGIVSGVENTPYTIKTADFGFTDPDDAPSNALFAVKIATLPGAGTLTDNGIAVSAGQFISASDISGGLLVFTPKTNLDGGPYFLCQFQVEDNGGTANGGQNLDQSLRVLDINIAHVNHAPVGTSSTITVTENTPYTLKISDFGFTDPNDPVPNSLLAVKFTILPTAGNLSDNGVALTAGQFVSAADISGGELVFTPNANLLGGPYFVGQFSKFRTTEARRTGESTSIRIRRPLTRESCMSVTHQWARQPH